MLKSSLKDIKEDNTGEKANRFSSGLKSYPYRTTENFGEGDFADLKNHLIKECQNKN